MGDVVAIGHRSALAELAVEEMKGDIEGCAVIAITPQHGLQVSVSEGLDAEQQNRLLAGVARLYYQLLSGDCP
jgi:hypothetical protein